MRDTYVPGPCVFTAEDIDGATAPGRQALRIAMAALGLTDSDRERIERFLVGDYERHVASAIAARERPTTTASALASLANLQRTGIYRHLERLAPLIEDCALAAVMLIDARGEFVGHTVWLVCHVESPVGRETKGTCITGTANSRRQTLFGLAIAGGDMTLPAILTEVPSETLSTKELAHDLAGMLLRADAVAQKLREYASALQDAGPLREFELTRAELANYTPPRALLCPALSVGPTVEPAGWRTSLVPDMDELLQHSGAAKPQHVVLAADLKPVQGAWHDIKPRRLQQMVAFAINIGLNLLARPSQLHYDRADAGDALHRIHLHAQSDGIDGGQPFASSRLGFLLHGFPRAAPPQPDTDREFARAIAYSEFIAGKDPHGGCLLRFAQQMAPAAVPAREARPVVRALRIMQNTPLVMLARKRQADNLPIESAATQNRIVRGKTRIGQGVPGTATNLR
jgi:hypothetical protein